MPNGGSVSTAANPPTAALVPSLTYCVAYIVCASSPARTKTAPNPPMLGINANPGARRSDLAVEVSKLRVIPTGLPDELLMSCARNTGLASSADAWPT